MRKQIVAGNWKMNTSITEGKQLANHVKQESADVPKNVELIVAPPFTHIAPVVTELNGSRVKVGSQNCAAWAKGAYTGEVSVEMIASVGASYIIVGHSERREYFSETNSTLLEKVKLGLSSNLIPIFCCGEKLEERNSNEHFNVLKTQIEEVVLKLSKEDVRKIIIAYEPIWAIGTGLTASPEQAQEMHQYIRSLLTKHFGDEVANSIPILYGGSCKPSNAESIFAKPDVDGGLIGGASLVASDFIAIAKSFPK